MSVINLNPGPYGGAFGLLWTDLETTGAEETLDDIIEFGAVVTDYNLDIIGETFSIVIQPSDNALGRMMKNEVVRNMHFKNGLLEECIDSSYDTYAAQNEIFKWLYGVINKGKTRGAVEKFRFALAGSGVGHFDNKFIKAHLHRVNALLTRQYLDIGDVRRFLKLCKVPTDPVTGLYAETKNHRALDDILLHLEEARAYRDMFKLLSGEDLKSHLEQIQ